MLITLLNLYIGSLLHTASANVFAAQETPQTINEEYSSIINILPEPYQKENLTPLDLGAKSIVVMDLNTGKILYEKNADERRPIGSITKLMTDSIILDENSLNGVAIVSDKAAKTDGSKIWLYPGEKITVASLLYASLIHSANDATYALAEHNAGSAEKFIEKMNRKAEMLGLKSTKFSNPVGFDDENNYSTAKDIAILARIAYKKPFIRQAASTSKMEITSIDNKIKHKLESTNNLLGKDKRIKGLKTGHTMEAGFSFVSAAENAYGNDIITVVLDSPDRFKETQILLDWTFNNFTW
jgi:D-alanyl-D-alanine carboxypeptidase